MSIDIDKWFDDVDTIAGTDDVHMPSYDYYSKNKAAVMALAKLGAAVANMPQGVSLARHGALGATKWCVENDLDGAAFWSIDGDDAFNALSNAEPFMSRYRDP